LNVLGVAAQPSETTYELQVFPPEHKIMDDPETGTQLVFLTTNPATDTNLYFHERSWFSDESVILFDSEREEGGLMGYIVETGELVRFHTPSGGLRYTTGALKEPGFYAMRGNEAVKIRVSLQVSEDPSATPSKAFATERVLCTFPEGSSTSTLNENCEGKLLSSGRSGPSIWLIEIETGQFRKLCDISDPRGHGGHVQWSHTDPNILSYAGGPNRLMAIDIREGKPWCPYAEREDEFITHESWWVNDQMLFCGGTHPEPTEDRHVKVLDVESGTVRIIGAGAWWPTGSDAEIARQNWWHAAGSDDGRWVAADNWYGDIMLFEGKTARSRLLTKSHRTYGHGLHPHVGWDRSGKAVVFTSHMLGDVNVCIARIPDRW
jgi:oligogalacturonide lyase